MSGLQVQRLTVVYNVRRGPLDVARAQGIVNAIAAAVQPGVVQVASGPPTVRLVCEHFGGKWTDVQAPPGWALEAVAERRGARAGWPWERLVRAFPPGA